MSERHDDIYCVLDIARRLDFQRLLTLIQVVMATAANQGQLGEVDVKRFERAVSDHRAAIFQLERAA